jgi:hypothetical protein
MKVVKETPLIRFQLYLQSIGGLKSVRKPGYPPITLNICECGDGWLPLIQKCIDELIKTGWNKEILQIKEKFGGLCIYANDLSEERYKIIEKYKELSYQTCENCGRPGTIRGEVWIRTLCNECYKN